MQPQLGETDVKVIKNENEVHFKGFGDLAFVDSLVVNLNGSLALFGKRHLYLTSITKLSKKYIPENEFLPSVLEYNANDILDIMVPNPSYYVLFLGRLGKSGKTYMLFVNSEYRQDGRQEKQVTMIFD